MCPFSFKVCGTDEEFDLRDRYCATEGIRKWTRVKLWDFCRQNAVICYIFVKREFVEEQSGLMYCSCLRKILLFFLSLTYEDVFYFFFLIRFTGVKLMLKHCNTGKNDHALYNTPQCPTIMQHNINLVFLQFVLLLSFHCSTTGRSVHSVQRTPAACWKRPSEVVL